MLQVPDDPYAPPAELKGLPQEIIMYQYEVCPYCNKVKAFLDYNKVFGPLVHGAGLQCTRFPAQLGPPRSAQHPRRKLQQGMLDSVHIGRNWHRPSCMQCVCSYLTEQSR